MKALFVGLGSIGQRHLRNLKTLVPNADVLAWRQTRGAPVLEDGVGAVDGPSLVERHGLIEVGSLEEGLEAQPEIVFVTTPSSLRMPIALAAAKAGAHLFLEKPLGTSWDGVEDLTQLVAQKGLVATVGFQLRFDPGLVQVSSWLAEGRIGAVTSASFVNGESLPRMHPWEDYRTGYAARRDLGGGSIHTQCHDLDLARWLFGMPERVFAVGGQRSALDLDVEDTATLLLACPGGVPVSVHLDFLRDPPERHLTVVGDAGRIRWDGQTRNVSLTLLGGEEQTQRFAAHQRNELFLGELREFLASVAGDASPRVSLADGVECLRIALAAHRSLRTGTAVGPEEVGP